MSIKDKIYKVKVFLVDKCFENFGKFFFAKNDFSENLNIVFLQVGPYRRTVQKKIGTFQHIFGLSSFTL